MSHSQLINEFCLFFLLDAQNAISDANLCAIPIQFFDFPKSDPHLDQMILNDLNQAVRKTMSFKI